MTKYIIVGQGLAGTLLAYQMHKNNIPFKIIVDPIQKSASEIAAGLINPLVFKRLTKVGWLIAYSLKCMRHTMKWRNYCQ